MGWPQLVPAMLDWPGVSTSGALPSRLSAFASLPLPWSKKIPYPPRIAVFPLPQGSHANPTRGAGFSQCRLQASARISRSSALHDSVEEILIVGGVGVRKRDACIGIQQSEVFWSSDGAFAGVHAVVLKLYSRLYFS